MDTQHGGTAEIRAEFTHRPWIALSAPAGSSDEIRRTKTARQLRSATAGGVDSLVSEVGMSFLTITAIRTRGERADSSVVALFIVADRVCTPRLALVAKPCFMQESVITMRVHELTLKGLYCNA